MKLERAIKLINNSSQRMKEALTIPKDKIWLAFMRQESSLMLKLALKLWFRLRFRAAKKA